MTVIYADLTLLLNGGLNYLVLCCTLRLEGLPLRHRRILAASLLGGAYAVLAAIPTYGFLTALPVKCIASLLMARLVFGRDGYFLRHYLLFLTVSCALSGACVGAEAVLRRTESPWVVLLLSGTFCAVALAVVFHRSGSVKQAALLLDATIVQGDRQVTVSLLADTGNTLRDPETDRVVCVVWEKALEPLGQVLYSRIPFQSLGQPAGELDYFYCDRLTIGGRSWYGYPIGVSPHPLSDGGGYVGLWGVETEGGARHAAKTV